MDNESLHTNEVTCKDSTSFSNFNAFNYDNHACAMNQEYSSCESCGGPHYTHECMHINSQFEHHSYMHTYHDSDFDHNFQYHAPQEIEKSSLELSLDNFNAKHTKNCDSIDSSTKNFYLDTYHHDFDMNYHDVNVNNECQNHVPYVEKSSLELALENFIEGSAQSCDSIEQSTKNIEMHVKQITHQMKSKHVVHSESKFFDDDDNSLNENLVVKLDDKQSTSIFEKKSEIIFDREVIVNCFDYDDVVSLHELFKDEVASETLDLDLDKLVDSPLHAFDCLSTHLEPSLNFMYEDLTINDCLNDLQHFGDFDKCDSFTTPLDNKNIKLNLDLVPSYVDNEIFHDDLICHANILEDSSLSTIVEKDVLNLDLNPIPCDVYKNILINKVPFISLDFIPNSYEFMKSDIASLNTSFRCKHEELTSFIFNFSLELTCYINPISIEIILNFHFMPYSLDYELLKGDDIPLRLLLFE